MYRYGRGSFFCWKIALLRPTMAAGVFFCWRIALLRPTIAAGALFCWKIALLRPIMAAGAFFVEKMLCFMNKCLKTWILRLRSDMNRLVKQFSGCSHMAMQYGKATWQPRLRRPSLCAGNTNVKSFFTPKNDLWNSRNSKIDQIQIMRVWYLHGGVSREPGSLDPGSWI